MALSHTVPADPCITDIHFVLAGIDDKLSIDKQDEETLLWDRDWHKTYQGPDLVVHGHCPNKNRIERDEFHINIDTALRLNIQVSQSVLKTADIIHDDEGAEN